MVNKCLSQASKGPELSDRESALQAEYFLFSSQHLQLGGERPLSETLKNHCQAE